MTDSEIETTIRRYILFKRRPQSEENIKDILYNKNLIINYCKKFYYFSNKIVSSKIYDLDNLLPKIIDQIQFNFYRKDTNIWKIGEDINDIYIIFVGEVNIYKPPEKKDNKIIMELDYILGKGYLLGGECLKYNYDFNNKRTNVVKAKNLCLLGKINAKEFSKLYKAILSEENNLLNNFLRDINVFSSEFNGNFLKATKLVYYKKDEYIFKQGDLFDTFYLIYRGNVRLCLYVKKLVKSKIDYDLLKGKNLNERFTTSRQFEIKGSYNEIITYNLIDAGKGDFIGGIEYINQYNKYNYFAKCSTDVALLKVDINQFNSILVNKEKRIFKEKIEKQEKYMKKRMRELRLEKDRIKINDYILSKNKYVKTFLQSNPLNKKDEEKLDKYINCNVNPIKVKYSNKNIKIIKTSNNIVPKFMEKYKIKKERKKSWKKKNLVIKDFITNIDYKKEVRAGNIFPMILFEEYIPKSQKTVFKIKEEEKKVDKTVNTEPLISKGRIKNYRSFSNINVRYKLNLKKNENENKLFNNISLKNHLVLDLRSSKNINININNLGSKRTIRKYNTFRK